LGKILTSRNLLRYLNFFVLSRIKPKTIFNYSSFENIHLSRAEIISLSKIKKTTTKAPLCCAWHIYRPIDVQYFLAFVREFPKIDHFVTFNVESCGAELLEYLAELQSMSHISLYLASNRGRDFRMATQFFYDISQGNYRYLSKLHFKERDQVSQKPISKKKSIYLIRRHIQGMQIIDSRKESTMKFYGLKEWIFDQASHLGKNELWLKKLCRRSHFSYQKLLYSQFVSGGMFVVSLPRNFLTLRRLINDEEFEEEKRKKLDGLLCHAMERFSSFFAISKGYEISYLPSHPPYFLNTFFTKRH